MYRRSVAARTDALDGMVGEQPERSNRRWTRRLAPFALATSTVVVAPLLLDGAAWWTVASATAVVDDGVAPTVHVRSAVYARDARLILDAEPPPTEAPVEKASARAVIRATERPVMGR
jgi:hypothetical protein